MCLPFGWFTNSAGEWLAGSSGLGISGLLLLSPCGVPGLGVSGLHWCTLFIFRVLSPFILEWGLHKFRWQNRQLAENVQIILWCSLNKVWLNLLACGDNLILLLLYSSFGYKRMLSKRVHNNFFPNHIFGYYQLHITGWLTRQKLMVEKINNNLSYLLTYFWHTWIF